MKESFSFKLFRSFVFSVMVISLFFVPFFIHFQQKSALEELTRRGQMFAGLLAYNARAGVFAERPELLEDAVQGIKIQKGVSAVAVYTNDDMLLISTPVQRGNESGGMRGDGRGTLPKPEEGRLFEVVEKERTLSVLAPVVLENAVGPEEEMYSGEPAKDNKRSVIGYVKVTMNKDMVSRETRAVLLRSALIALIFLVSGIVVTYVMIKKVTGPLIRLNDAVDSLGSGEWVGQLPVESRDEIGKLAMSFNLMYENLKRREEEKTALEESLRRSQKMEAVGTLARGVAHDFNNILSTVQGSVFLLDKKMARESHLRHYIEQMHGAINKAKSLIQGLITFSRIQRMEPVAFDLNAIASKLKPLLRSIAGERIEIDIDQSPGTLDIVADPIQIEQVLMNLCSNAADAMPDGGKITIKTESRKVPEDFIAGAGIAPGNYAVIAVSDTGEGMDEEVKDRIFEPFFTTKEVGRGTGLGLSIVFGIVEQLNGYIDVHTQKGVETVFSVYIPTMEKTG